MSDGVVYELGRIVFVVASCALFIWAARRYFGQRDMSPRTTCRRCGYDVRQSPEKCPECGARVPDELALRIDLFNNDIPHYLLDDDHALPLREPEPGERFCSVVIYRDRSAYDLLLTLLRRAGIASEGSVHLGPAQANNLFQLRARQPMDPRFEVAVPAADYAVAMELVRHVWRRLEKQTRQ